MHRAFVQELWLQLPMLFQVGRGWSHRLRLRAGMCCERVSSVFA